MKALKILTIICIFFPNIAFSETVSSQASIEIVTPLTVNQERELHFGKVEIPTTGRNRVRVRRNGNYFANSQGTIGSFQTSAQFRIFGQPNAQVNYTVNDINSTIPGVDFDRLYIPASQTINNNGRKRLRVGGRIFVYSNAVPGTYTNGELSYTFTVEYE